LDSNVASATPMAEDSSTKRVE
jgi:hypothetical protein